jgi:hypothetical protein
VVSGHLHAPEALPPPPPAPHWIGGWVDPWVGMDNMVAGVKLLTLPGLKLCPLHFPADSQLLYRLRYCCSYGDGMLLENVEISPVYTLVQPIKTELFKLMINWMYTAHSPYNKLFFKFVSSPSCSHLWYLSPCHVQSINVKMNCTDVYYVICLYEYVTLYYINREDPTVMSCNTPPHFWEEI